MNLYDTVIVVLYAALFAMTSLWLSEQWNLAMIVVFLLIIFLAQKIRFEDELDKIEKKRDETICMVSEKLDKFSGHMNQVNQDLNRHMFTLENRIMEERKSYELEMEKSFRELSRRIVDAENGIMNIKKTLGAALGSFEERLEMKETNEGVIDGPGAIPEDEMN